MFDGNAMAEGFGCFALGGIEVSPDARLAAFAVDSVGRRFYALRVKDLTTGELLDDWTPAAASTGAAAGVTAQSTCCGQRPRHSTRPWKAISARQPWRQLRRARVSWPVNSSRIAV